MANSNGPFGLKPLRVLSGGEVSMTKYSVATDYATAIYTGDLVKLTGTDTNLAKSASGDIVSIGVFAGCQWRTAKGDVVFSPYWPGVSDSKTDIKAYVYDNPQTVFLVQADGCLAANIGNVCDINVGTGNASTGLSGLYAVVSGLSATTGGTLRVLRLWDNPKNEYGSYAKIEVVIAEHAYHTGAASASGV